MVFRRVILALCAVTLALVAYGWHDYPALQGVVRPVETRAQGLWYALQARMAPGLAGGGEAEAAETPTDVGPAGPLIPWRAGKQQPLARRISPSKGKAPPKSSHTFVYDGRRYTVSADVPATLYAGATAASSEMRGLPGMSQAEVNTAVFNSLVFDPAQLPVLNGVSAQLRAIRDKYELDSDRYVELISKYVQTLPYDMKKAASASACLTQRYPVQTIADKTGVCGDKCALLAALLAHEGYNVSILIFAKEQHATVGIVGIGPPYPGTKYKMLETTQPSYVGEVPATLGAGIRLTSKPQVIRVGSGKRAYTASKEVDRILASRAKAYERLDAAQAHIKQMQPLKWALAKPKYDLLFKASRKLAWTDKKGQAEFLDRPAAVAWLDSSAWWDEQGWPEE